MTYQQANIGLDYFLSKRTDLCAVVLCQHASGTDSTGNKAVAAIYGFTPSSTSNQVGATAGIRHAF